MIAHVARREVLGHLRSPRFVALCALAVALLAVGAWIDAGRFEARMAYADALDAQRQSAVAFDRAGPDEVVWRYGWRGGRVVADPAMRAVRPPTPASVFAIGGDLDAPGFWQFGTEGMSAGASTEAGSLGGRSATLDLEFVVRVVLSLVAMLLAADAVAGDRETGMLRALFAAPVSRVDVLLGKWLGGLLTLALPLTLGSGVACLVLAAHGIAVLDADVWPRVLLLLAGALLFLSASLALALYASAHCRDARTATVLLVALWVAAVLIVPNGAALVAAAVAPVTPAEVVRQARTDGLRQLEVERAHVLARLWRTATGSDDVPRDGRLPDDAKRRYDALRRGAEVALMQRKRALLRDLDDRRVREERRQSRLVGLLGAVSPAATFGSFAAAAAGTGRRLEERWEGAAREHQARLERASFDQMHGTELFDARADFLRISFLPGPGDAADRVPTYAEMPAFAPPEPALGADLADALAPLVLLAGENLVFLVLAAVAVTRMEV